MLVLCSTFVFFGQPFCFMKIRNFPKNVCSLNYKSHILENIDSDGDGLTDLEDDDDDNDGLLDSGNTIKQYAIRE